MQVLSFHPSIVFTEAAAKAGYTRDTLPWTDGMPHYPSKVQLC